MEHVRRETSERSIRITEEAQTTLAKRFEIVREAGKNAKNQSPTPKIQKVIFYLQNHKDFEKHYEPRVVSVGPIHHGKPKYKLGEKYKLVLTSEFIEDSGKSMGDVYKKIKEKIKELRDCFEEEVTKDYDDDAFAWLLFVDGCAILQFIYCLVKDKFKDLNIKNDSAAFGNQDLLLLENQLPYRLLILLMSLSEKKTELEDSIKTFIQRNISVPPEDHSSIFRCEFLSGLSWKLCQRSKRRQAESEKKKNDYSKEKLQEQRISIEGDPIHLLDLLRTRLLANHGGQVVQNINPKKQMCLYWQSYRNIEELQAAGIHLKRSQISQRSLGDISFTTLLCFGFLWLPPMIVDDLTGPKFLNLIAYELCPDFMNDYGVTTYISFLESLIDEAKDVKELRKAGILYNLLGSDQEVAQLFNEIGTDLVPNNDIYNDVRSKIQQYYKNKVKTLISQAINDHFRSPWTFIAFLAAFLALLLSALQTWYTVPWLSKKN